jgi:hypothetical protein
MLINIMIVAAMKQELSVIDVVGISTEMIMNGGDVVGTG